MGRRRRKEEKREKEEEVVEEVEQQRGAEGDEAAAAVGRSVRTRLPVVLRSLPRAVGLETERTPLDRPVPPLFGRCGPSPRCRLLEPVSKDSLDVTLVGATLRLVVSESRPLPPR